MSDDQNDRLAGDQSVGNPTIDDNNANVGAGGTVGAAGIGAADALGTEEDRVTGASGPGEVTYGSANSGAGSSSAGGEMDASNTSGIGKPGRSDESILQGLNPERPGIATDVDMDPASREQNPDL